MVDHQLFKYFEMTKLRRLQVSPICMMGRFNDLHKSYGYVERLYSN